MTEETSEFLHKEPCPACGSKDNLGRYSDGHAYCFGCEYREPPTEGDHTSTSKRPKEKRMADGLITSGKHRALPKRKITVETARRYDYCVAKRGGEHVHVANCRDQNGDVVAQHLRTEDKDFPWIGDSKSLQLFGQHAAREGAPKVIITEGELDAMSVHEIISSGRGTRWAAVSITSGAKSAKKDIARNLQWLEKADEVILMLDNDEPGIAAANECARLFSPGKCKIATLPLKDASDMLVAGRGAEVIDAIFGAKSWRPEGVVRVADVMEDVLTDPVWGAAWWHEGLNNAVRGRRLGEADGLGAGTGVGKTDMLTQQVEFDINTLGLKVGLFFLEQGPPETVRRVAGKAAGRKFHLPSDDENPWTVDELETAVENLNSNDNLVMYNAFGVTDWEIIEDAIRFLHHSEGINYFYLDHLTALAAAKDDERKYLEEVMAYIASLAKELHIWIGFVSHLATPDGKPHEEGGRVMIRHFKGSRAIGYWSFQMYGLERNQQAEPDDDDYGITTLRILKCRADGSKTGKTFALGYDNEAGRLVPTEFGSGSSFEPIDGAEDIF